MSASPSAAGPISNTPSLPSPMKKRLLNPSPRRSAIVAAALCLTGVLHAEDAWWNKDWTQRQKITLDTADISGPAGETTVLVRLSEGRFQFASSENGKDIRFVAADGKTVLPHQIETYDGILNEAFVWVKLPDVKAGAKESFYLYYGNLDPAMPAGAKPTDAYGDDLAAVYHFAQAGSAPADSTANGNNAETPATTAEGAIIGNGLRLLGNAPVSIPNTANAHMDRRPGPHPLGLDQTRRPPAQRGHAQPDRWQHLVPPAARPGNPGRRNPQAAAPRSAASPARRSPPPHGVMSPSTASGGKLQLFVNGEPYTITRRRHPRSRQPAPDRRHRTRRSQPRRLHRRTRRTPHFQHPPSPPEPSSSPSSTRAAAMPPSAPSPSVKSKAARRPEAAMSWNTSCSSATSPTT